MYPKKITIELTSKEIAYLIEGQSESRNRNSENQACLTSVQTQKSKLVDPKEGYTDYYYELQAINPKEDKVIEEKQFPDDSILHFEVKDLLKWFEKYFQDTTLDDQMYNLKMHFIFYDTPFEIEVPDQDLKIRITKHFTTTYYETVAYFANINAAKKYMQDNKDKLNNPRLIHEYRTYPRKEITPEVNEILDKLVMEIIFDYRREKEESQEQDQ